MKVKKSKFKVFIWVCIAILMSSCIELEEKITIHEDLSGKVIYQLNMSELGSLFSGIFNNEIENQIKTETDKLVQKLRSQPGIHNVVYKSSMKAGGFSLSFDYDKVKDFNNALFAMGDAKKTMFTPGYLKASKHRVKKINFSNYLSIYMKKENIEIPEEYLSNNITFKSSITVPNKINRTQGIDVKITNSNTTAQQTFQIKQILHDKINTRIKIKY